MQLMGVTSSVIDMPWWTLAGVILGGLIATVTQLILHRYAVAAAERDKSESQRAASRMLRDDMRSTEARIYFALKDKVWWRDEDIAPLLHTGEDLRAVAAHIRNPVRWGDVATARRTMLRIDNRRRAGRPLDRAWLIRSFQDLEAARTILARDVEGFTLKPIQWAADVDKMAR